MSTKKNEKRFYKEQIINSAKFGKYRDLLSAVLEEERAYAESEINKAINDYMERSVE